MGQWDECFLWEDQAGANPQAWNLAWREGWDADADIFSLAMTAASVASAALPKLELRADLLDLEPAYVILPGLELR